MRYLLLLLLSYPVFATTYNCVNNVSTDTAGVQAGLNAGGLLTVSGSCKLNSVILGVNGTDLEAGLGGTVWTAQTNGGVYVNFNATGAFKMNGIQFEGFLWNSNNALTGATITNNILENTTGGSFPNGGGWVSNGFHNSLIKGNTFHNLFAGGYVVYPPLSGNPGNTAQPACWQDYQGLDGTTITLNSFDECANDGFHINPNGSIVSAVSSEFSFNKFTNIHRAFVEIQAFVSNFVVKGNYAYNTNAPFFDSFGYSIASVGTNFTFINNFGTLNSQNCAGGVADFLENSLAPSLIQGNVSQNLPITGACVPFGSGGSPNRSWTFEASASGDNTTNPSNTNTLQNNVMCGNSYAVVISSETNGPPPHNRNDVDQYNYKNTTSCPVATIGASAVSTPVFTSAPGQTFPSGGVGTWTTTQISALPIINTSFFLDGSSSPIVFQELQDVNTGFSSDLKWHYHATFNTSSLAGGSHTIKAVATDVLGATANASQTFTVGSVSGPSVSFSPTSVVYGTVVVGSSSSPSVVSLTNVGTSTLNITSFTVTGTNAADFSQTHACGSTLAAAASCNITVTFTPSAMGSRTASISMVDNATGSPHTIPLTGVGSSFAACAGIILNCAFTAGSASWSANTSPFATWTVDSSGPSGAPAADFSITSVVTPGSNVELFQDNLSLTNGTTYTLTFLANTNNTQQISIFGVNSTTFVPYGLAFQPVISPGWQSYTVNFVASGSPPAGAVRVTIQMDNANPGDSIQLTNFSLAPGISTEVNNITFPFVDHGALAVNFTTLTSSTNTRVRYIVSPGVCTGGTGGAVQINQLTSNPATFNQLSLGGLAPATTYQVCPEVSKNSGSTWSTGAGATITTLPLPAIHPEPPINPLRFDTSYPNVTSGAFVYVTYSVLSDCSDFGTAYTTAISNWALVPPKGTIITVPAGTTCTTTHASPFAFSSIPPDVHTWQPSDVNTSTGEITWTGHGMSEGDLVSFGMTYRSSSVYPASTSCDVGYGTIIGGGIQSGQRYPVHVTGPNTFQVHCLAAIPGQDPNSTNLMSFTTQGSSSSGGFYATPWQLVLNTLDNEFEWQRSRLPWIIVRSATPDAQLPPEHTAITPAWASKMAIFLDPATNVATSNLASSNFMVFGDSDSNEERPIGNTRIGPGIKFVTEDYASSIHSSDPWFFTNVLVTYPWDGGIVFDRIWYHMLGAPNREQIGFYWTGSNVGAIDSHWDDLTYFHANNVGLVPSRTSGTVASITPGTAYTGSTPCVIPSTETVTISGSGTGRAFVYCNMLSSNAFTVSVPASVTASCSPTSCASAVAGTNTSSCNVSDGWPKTARGEVTVAQIACIDISAGAISTVTQAAYYTSAWNPEGDSHMLGGIGPGPYKFCGNYSEGAGLTWHWDDAGVASFRGNTTICQNYFYSNPKYMYTTTNTATDHLRYYNRQPMEWKGGQFLNIWANIYDTVWREDIPNSTFTAMTPTLGGWISDVHFHDNTYRHGSGVIEGINGTCSGVNTPCARPGVRYLFENNQVYDINGYFYTAAFSGDPNVNFGVGLGWNFQVLGVEDWVINHNTYAPNRGADPLIAAMDANPIEGFQQTNNINWYSGVPTQNNTSIGSANYAPAGCTSLTDVSYLNCAATRGIGVTNYSFGQNLIAGGWTDSSVPSGQSSSATMTTAFTGLTNTYLATGTVAGTITAIKWVNPTVDNILFNYSLRNDSPYKAGNNPYGSKSDLGVNVDALNAAQGLLKGPNVPSGLIGTTGASITYVAPNTSVCWIDYSSTDPNVITAFTRVADSGGDRARAVALTGLTTHTNYHFRVECQGGNSQLSQIAAQFETR